MCFRIIKSPERNYPQDLGTCASLRLEDCTARAAELAEASRIFVSRHTDMEKSFKSEDSAQCWGFDTRRTLSFGAPWVAMFADNYKTGTIQDWYHTIQENVVLETRCAHARRWLLTLTICGFSHHSQNSQSHDTRFSHPNSVLSPTSRRSRKMADELWCIGPSRIHTV